MIMGIPMKQARPEPLPEAESGKDAMLHSLDKKDENVQVKKNGLVVFVVYIVLILLGVGTGYLLVARSTGEAPLAAPKGTPIKTATVVGVQDASTFKDCATGQLEKGGLNGEGTYHLIRPGGPSQTAYLTSSVIDMSPYVGKTVKVCGQTIAAQHVSWLMDVGRLEIQ